jgi:hypothetical protein
MAYAMAAPIPRGKTAAVRRFLAECLGPRKEECDDLQRRSGIREESYWLQSDPEDGDTLIVVSDGPQEGFWAIMANPQTAFDRWYREQIESIWEFDATQPGAPNEHLGTWRPSA